MTYDIVLRNAHVIDPSQQLNGQLDVALRDGRIAAIGEGLEGLAKFDLRGYYLCPGLVDLHGHWYEGSLFGIDPNLCLNHGVTTVIDAGTTGFVNWREFRKHTIETAQIRVRAFLNISAIGIPTAAIGELQDLRYAMPLEAAEALTRDPSLLGVKVRIGDTPSGENGRAALERALEAAAACRRPVMAHIGRGCETPDVLMQLRPGDILTHCFQGRGDGLISEGRLLPEAIEARNAGVIFDVGHGCGSFRWETAKRAFEHFFFPDTISTDLHRYSVERWCIDMPTTMSKFLHLGMSLEDVILKTTHAPAKAAGLEGEAGTLRLGSAADLFAFSIEEGEFPLEDTHLKMEIAGRMVRPHLTFRDGRPIAAGSQSGCLRSPHACDLDVFRTIEESA